MAVTSFVPPAIEIHLAQDEPASNAIPTSPFSPKRSSHLAMQILNSSSSESEESEPEEDSLRPKHLMPPPLVSPLRPPMPRAAPADKKGIDQERFAKLLQSTRRKKEPADMRRQVQLKAHQSRAQERRALFLSRLEAPPSNLAVQTPVTPPESPAIFHFTLPSPGLASPLALFEQIAKERDHPTKKKNQWNGDHNIQIVTPARDAIREPVIESISQQTSRFKREPWIEEVDFKSRLRSVPPKTPASPGFQLLGGYHNRRPNCILPSLDQITAHLASVAANNTAAAAPILTKVDVVAQENAPTAGPQEFSRRLGHQKAPSIRSDTPRPPIPLPAFLNARRAKPAPLNIQPVAKPVINDLEPTPSSFTRPMQTPSESPQATAPPTPPRMNRPAPPVRTPSGSVVSGPKVVSPSNMRVLPSKPQSTSPQVFTPTPIIARLPFSSMSSPNRGATGSPVNSGPSPSRTQKGRDMVETLKRRSSAPAQLPPNKKPAHRVMTMKGGF